MTHFFYKNERHTCAWYPQILMEEVETRHKKLMRPPGIRRKTCVYGPNKKRGDLYSTSFLWRICTSRLPHNLQFCAHLKKENIKTLNYST